MKSLLFSIGLITLFFAASFYAGFVSVSRPKSVEAYSCGSNLVNKGCDGGCGERRRYCYCNSTETCCADCYCQNDCNCEAGGCGSWVSKTITTIPGYFGSKYIITIPANDCANRYFDWLPYTNTCWQ